MTAPTAGLGRGGERAWLRAPACAGRLRVQGACADMKAGKGDSFRRVRWCWLVRSLASSPGEV